MAFLQAVSIDGVTFTVGERLRIDYEGEAPRSRYYLPTGIYRLTEIYMNPERSPDIYLVGQRAERASRPGGRYWIYLPHVREWGYVFRKLESPKARKTDGAPQRDQH